MLLWQHERGLFVGAGYGYSHFKASSLGPKGASV